MDQLDRFHGDFIPVGFETRSLDLVDPGVLDVPAHDIIASFVHEDDRSVATIRNAINDVGVPIPQLSILCVTTLEHDVCVFAQTNELADVEWDVSAFTIVDRISVA